MFDTHCFYFFISLFVHSLCVLSLSHSFSLLWLKIWNNVKLNFSKSSQSVASAVLKMKPKLKLWKAKAMKATQFSFMTKRFTAKAEFFHACGAWHSKLFQLCIRYAVYYQIGIVITNSFDTPHGYQIMNVYVPRLLLLLLCVIYLICRRLWFRIP